MKNASKYIHQFLTVALVLGGWVAMPMQAQGEEDGEPKDFGFIIDDNFSTFISVNGETVIDVFEAIFGEAADVGATDPFLLFNAVGNQDFAPDLPTEIAVSTFINVLSALEGTGGVLPESGLQLAYNPDPFIGFNTTFTNTSDAPAEFDYNFFFPVLPVVGPTDVILQLSLDLVDANGDGTASVTLNQFDDVIQQVGFMEGGIFGTFTDPDLGIGTEITTLGETLFAPEISAGPEAATAFDGLTVFGRFTLSAGDSVRVTGLGGLVEAGEFLPTLASFNFDNFPSLVVPEPSSALLLMLGLATGLGRSRNRQRA